MENIIKMENINFNYKDKKIFDNLNLIIKKNIITTITGSNGSGKSTLSKIIRDNINNVAFAPELPVNFFNIETSKEYIIYYLKNFNYSSKEIEKKINYITSKLNLNDLLNCSFDTLSMGEKQLISIASVIVSDKDIIIDNALSMIDEYQKETIFKILIKQKNRTILNITNNVEEIIYGKQTIIINDGKIIINDSTKNILDKEKIFRDCNLDLPFMASLSLKLKYYNLLDKPILDIDKMVNKLWM